LNPAFVNPPVFGLERSPEGAGLLLPLAALPAKFAFGFQPVPLLRSVRESSPRGRKPSAPSPRGVKGRDGRPGALAEPRPEPPPDP